MGFNFRYCLVAAAGIGLVAGCRTDVAQKNAANRPNILFIIVDDSNFSQYACFGGKALTPNIDRLAREGMLFEQAYTSSSICTPTRYSVLTGQYASRAPSLNKECQTDRFPSFIRWNTDIDPSIPNTAHVLRDAGYFTGMVGKWHIGYAGVEEALKSMPSPLPADHSILADPADPAVKAYLKILYDAGVEGIKRSGFDYVDRLYQANPDDKMTPWSTQCQLNQHNPEWITEGALEFLDKAAQQEKPFYLYLSTTLLHLSPDPTADLKTGNPLITPLGLLDKAPDVQPSRASVLERIRAAGLPEEAAMGLWFDDGVGAVLQRLETLGLADNTLVVFFSDQQIPGKDTCYDAGVNTPMLMRWPGRIAPGTRNDDLISNIDFAPTFFAAAHVQPPEDMHLDGLSFLPLVQGGKIPWRDALFFELGDMRAVRTREWKYIAVRALTEEQWNRMSPKEREEQEFRKRYFRNEAVFDRWAQEVKDGTTDARSIYRTAHRADYLKPDALYDLKSDPQELNNLAANPAYAEPLKSMKKRLTEWLDTMPGPYGEFKTSNGSTEQTKENL